MPITAPTSMRPAHHRTSMVVIWLPGRREIGQHRSITEISLSTHASVLPPTAARLSRTGYFRFAGDVLDPTSRSGRGKLLRPADSNDAKSNVRRILLDVTVHRKSADL